MHKFDLLIFDKAQIKLSFWSVLQAYKEPNLSDSWPLQKLTNGELEYAVNQTQTLRERNCPGSCNMMCPKLLPGALSVL